MISKQIFQFLKELKKNNNRDWFNANKEKYQAANAEFEDFVNVVTRVQIKNSHNALNAFKYRIFPLIRLLEI